MVTVGYQCHRSWHLPSGRQWLGIGWAPCKKAGGAAPPRFQCTAHCPPAPCSANDRSAWGCRQHHSLCHQVVHEGAPPDAPEGRSVVDWQVLLRSRVVRWSSRQREPGASAGDTIFDSFFFQVLESTGTGRLACNTPAQRSAEHGEGKRWANSVHAGTQNPPPPLPRTEGPEMPPAAPQGRWPVGPCTRTCDKEKRWDHTRRGMAPLATAERATGRRQGWI